MGLSGTVLQICLRFTHEGKHDKKTDCKSASKRIIMMQVALPIFPVSRIRLYAWKLLSPMVYFSFLNEDSMFHLALYKVLIRSTGNSSRGRLVTMHSYVEVLIGKRRIRKDSSYVS